jgi:glutamyl-tRNA synthetase
LAWLYARCDDSAFLLRFEDLDQDAVRAEHYRSQRQDLHDLGLDWDEPVWNQSERLASYDEVLRRLRADDLVYSCFCSRREIREAASAPNSPYGGHHYPGTCARLDSRQRSQREADRPAALRVRAEGLRRGIDDELCGPVQLDLDDFVVQRNDGTPAYHLAVVVDDAAQDIDLVVRGDDLLESACRQLLLYDVLGLKPPTAYAHVPLVLAADGNRLAKRHGAVDLDQRRARGESASEVLSHLAATIGLAEKGEPVTMTRLLERFDRRRFAARAPFKPTTLSDDYLAV